MVTRPVAIQSNNLTKEFTYGNGFLKKIRKIPPKKLVAVDDVTLDIRERELFGLLGPNGAGKTSIIKMLATLLLPDSGSATVNGWDVEKNSFEVRMSIGVTLSSERQLYWKLSARENLEYFSSLYLIHPREIRERVSNLVDMMGLADSQEKLIESFSSGNRQKVSLARALLNDPPILFLDEPTIGLDPSYSLHFRKMIRDVVNKKEKKTILLTTHYMEEAHMLCDRIAFLNMGKIVALDTPKNLIKSIDEKETVTFTISRFEKTLLKKIESLEAVTSAIHYTEAENEILKVYTDSTSGCLQDIISILTERRIKILAFKSSKPTLEDVFIKITGSGLHG